MEMQELHVPSTQCSPNPAWDDENTSLSWMGWDFGNTAPVTNPAGPGSAANEAVRRTFGSAVALWGVSIGSLYFTILQLTSSQLQACGLKYACSQMPKSTPSSILFCIATSNYSWMPANGLSFPELQGACCWSGRNNRSIRRFNTAPNKHANWGNSNQSQSNQHPAKLNQSSQSLMFFFRSEARGITFFQFPGSFCSLVESTWSSPKFGHPAT